MTDGLEEMGLPPLGHNKPPEDDPKPLDAATLFDELDALIANANRWRAERPKITDAEMAGQAQKFIDQLRGLRDDLGLCMKRERRPLDDAVELIKLRFKQPISKAEIALHGMLALAKDWLDRERARLNAERIERERQADAAIAEAARLQHEAEQAGASVEAQLAAQEANERAADMTEAALDARDTRPQVKGDYATKAMSLHSNWKARVINETVALRQYAKHPKIRAAALKAIVSVASKEAQAAKDASKAPPGVEFYNDERAQ